MILATLLLAAAQSSSPAKAPPQGPDAMAAALVDLYAVVEEDGQPDRRMRSLQTTGCSTRVVSDGREWNIDWRKADAVALEDTFVFVSAPPAKLAFVGDASKPDQAAKLRVLSAAVQDVARRVR